MYKLEKTEYGIKIIFSGNIDVSEVLQWKTESELLLEDMSNITVYTDISDGVLSNDAQLEIVEAQKIYREKGIKKSVIIVSSVDKVFQFKEIALEHGIYDYERYISLDVQNYEAKALAWILEDKDFE